MGSASLRAGAALLLLAKRRQGRRRSPVYGRDVGTPRYDMDSGVPRSREMTATLTVNDSSGSMAGDGRVPSVY